MYSLYSKLCPLLIFLFCLGWHSTIAAQEVIIQTQYYGVEEGVSYRDVQCVHQDERSVMWFGTRFGLNRFDGYHFKSYTKELHGLASNSVNHILEDQQGRFWLWDTGASFIELTNAITIFDPITEQGRPFEDVFGDTAPFAAKNVRSFCQNEAGHFLFLLYDDRLITYDGQFQTLTQQRLEVRVINDIHWTKDQLIWVNGTNEESKPVLLALGTDGDLRFQQTYDQFEQIKFLAIDPQGNYQFILSNRSASEPWAIKSINAAGHEQYHPLSDNPIIQERLAGKTFSPIDFLSIVGDRLWASTHIDGEERLEIIDPTQQVFYRGGTHFEEFKTINNIFRSSNGMIWVVTGFGIYQFNIQPNQFSRILYAEDADPIATRNLQLDHTNHLWIIPEGSLNLWKASLASPSSAYPINQTYAQDRLPFTNSINALGRRRNNDLFYISSNRLVQFEPNTLTFQSDSIHPRLQNYGSVWALYEDKNGLIWYGLDNGTVGYFDGQNAAWLLPADSISGPDYFYQFFEDQRGQVWLATDKGLLTLDLERKALQEHYWSGGKGKYHLPFDNIYHIHEDQDGVFWLGTGGTGLVRWGNPYDMEEQNDPQQFTRAQGLNNVIYAVYEDNSNNLWLASDNGIIRFNKQSHRATTYLESDGITHNEFNRVSHTQGPDGRLFFGGLNGVTTFHPKDFQSDRLAKETPLIITEYQHFDSEGEHIMEKEAELRQNRTITIAPSDRFFRLAFALLTYTDTEQNLYAYKIEGIDKDWTYQKENFIRFTRLPYGTHQLRIKGQSADGQWSEQELNIQLLVLKPFYFKAWFILAAILSIILLVLALIRRRTRQLKQQRQQLELEVARQTQEIREQAEELKSLEKLKSRFFANVSHELRTPLTLMLGPLDSLIKKGKWNRKERNLMQFIQNNGKHLLKLVNEILDLSKLESNRLDINETTVNFYQFLQPLVAQFSSFGDSESVQLLFDYRVDQHLVIQLDTDKFEKIAHNFLSNALKFTPAGGKVEFCVEEEEHTILLSVKDTGKGIHPNDLPHIFDRFYQSQYTDTPVQGGTGIGLSLCKELADLLGGQVWAESILDAGSTFYFQFPKQVAEGPVTPSDSHEGQMAPVQLSVEDTPASAHEDLSESATESQLSTPVIPTVADQTEPPSLLIVEDNTDLRNYIQTILEEDFRVVTAENGQVAWELLSDKDSSSSFDLIVSDLMMPVMNGFELLEKVKQDDALRHLPIVMLTARADVRVKLRALRVGVDDYLIKPFLEDELKIRIQNLLNNLQERLKAHGTSAPFESDQDLTQQASPQPVIGEADAEWLRSVEQTLEQRLDNPQLTLEWVAQQLYTSKRQLHRKLKQLTGLTPNQYLREIRLQKAREHIYKGRYRSVKEVAQAVGFSSAKYFSRVFQERYGISPSEQLWQ